MRGSSLVSAGGGSLADQQAQTKLILVMLDWMNKSVLPLWLLFLN